ncbi:rac GTPase-activating protein 1 isoform X2 [Harpegnathos saltator]|uniref:rac GTPase-activating protein 1 isoform X2 n=1 Tax=Harpegnathos saltator TaxID=610380 RepID=UPI00058EB893|nr:rac GTPase-activating protein 1 isoform X2 [Harpegnathos saltator]
MIDTIGRRITNMSNARNELKNEWQELQQFQTALDKAQQEVTNLDQKLCHARRNLEEEKRKRRMVEKQRDLLESQISAVREILFHNEEVSLDEGIKKRLQFLNKPVITRSKHSVHISDTQNDRQLNAIMEMDSTGSILSDLNCLSKSEDDLDTNVTLLQSQKHEWEEHTASCESLGKQHNTLVRVAEFNSSDRAAAKSSDGTYMVSCQTQDTSGGNENVNSKVSETRVHANHIFVSKMVIKPETCTPCGKRIRFGKIMLKCRDCPIMCHMECKTTIWQLCVREQSTALCGMFLNRETQYTAPSYVLYTGLSYPHNR